MVHTAVGNGSADYPSGGLSSRSPPKDTGISYKICVNHGKRVRKQQNELSIWIMGFHMSV